METRDEIKLDVSKTFPVPVEALYRAWIEPEALKQWWHPMGNQLTDVTNEVRNGGQIRYAFSGKDGQPVFTIQGQYQTVEEQKKLVYTWNWEIPEETVHNSDFLLTIEFEPAEEGSRLKVRQENFSSEEAVHPHQEGWDKALESLHQFLGSNKK